MKTWGQYLTRWSMLVGFGIISIGLIQFAGSAIIIGDRLARVHPFLELAFYTLALALIFVFLIRPVVTIFLKPTASLGILESETIPIKESEVRKVAGVLLKHGALDETPRAALTAALNTGRELRQSIAAIIVQKKKAADDLIVGYAGKAFIGVAASQSGRLDAIWLIGTNLHLISDLVRLFCFRSSFSQLVKLYIVVAYGALFAEQLEDGIFEDGDLLSSVGLKSTLTAAGAELLVPSFLQGVSGGLITLKIGFLAKEYILTGGDFNLAEARKGASSQARRHLPQLTVDAVKRLTPFGALARKFRALFSQPAK